MAGGPAMRWFWYDPVAVVGCRLRGSAAGAGAARGLAETGADAAGPLRSPARGGVCKRAGRAPRDAASRSRRLSSRERERTDVPEPPCAAHRPRTPAMAHHAAHRARQASVTAPAPEAARAVGAGPARTAQRALGARLLRSGRPGQLGVGLPTRVCLCWRTPHGLPALRSARTRTKEFASGRDANRCQGCKTSEPAREWNQNQPHPEHIHVHKHTHTHSHTQTHIPAHAHTPELSRYLRHTRWNTNSALATSTTACWKVASSPHRTRRRDTHNSR